MDIDVDIGVSINLGSLKRASSGFGGVDTWEV